MIIRIIDGLSEFTGKLSAWTLVAIGCFITYEVVARHFFNAPTIWVDEISRVLQVWVVFLAAAYVLKHREMVTIEIILSDRTTRARRLAESFGLCVMFLFAGAALWFGFQLWLKETLAGHTTDSFLAPPKWFTQAPVWVGSALLILQGLAELWKIWTVGIPAKADDVTQAAH